MNQKYARVDQANLGYYMSLAEIAAIEGVSKERIRQLLERAIKKSNEFLLNKYGDSVTLTDILPIPNKESHYEQMQKL